MREESDINKMYEDIKEGNLKLLKEVEQNLVKDIYLILEEVEIEIHQQPFKVVDYFKGQKQTIEYFCEINDPSKFKKLKYIYVNQTVNGGYIGDDFAGEIYIPISGNKFLEVLYSI